MPFRNVMFYTGSICHEPFSHKYTGEQIRAIYSYKAYIRCIGNYLSTYLSNNRCIYLLYTGQPVLNHGRTTFYMYQPKISNFPSDGPGIVKALGPGKVVGTFARTASIRSWKEKYGIPEFLSYVQDNKTKQYELIDVVVNKNAEIPGKTLIQFKNAFGTTVHKIGNASSRILKDDANQFIDRMLEKKIGFPVFSVCDCNSFHTTGYIWGTYALRAVASEDEDAPVAFINFDQHPDTGGGDFVGSDTWGDALLANVKNGCYISIGNAGTKVGQGGNTYTWINSFVLRKDGKRIAPPAGKVKIRIELIKGDSWEDMDAARKAQYIAGVIGSVKSTWVATNVNNTTDLKISNLSVQADDFPVPEGCDINPSALVFEDIFEKFFSTLKDLFGAIRYTFITIDRDALQDHQTQWGDLCFFPNGTTLINTIQSVYSSLIASSPHCELIGLDITGLPESRVTYEQQTQYIVEPSTAWSKAEDQIIRLHTWGESVLKLQAEKRKRAEAEKQRQAELLRQQEQQRREEIQLDSQFAYRMSIIFENLLSDLRGVKLKSYISGQDRTMIASFWQPLRLKLDTMGTDWRKTKEIRTALENIAGVLRTAARKKSGMSKELKGLLHAYANRVSSLLQL